VKFLLILLLFFSGFWYIRNQPIVIFYTYNGPYPCQIHKGLNQWNLSNIFFKKSDCGILHITHNNPQDLTNPFWGGEYRNSHILLNQRYRLTEEHLKNLVTHEAGHFIGLNHNSNANSLMNHSSSYDTKMSKEDIQSAKNVKILLWFKMLSHRLTVAPCP
jgi:hypothetical protein